MPAPQITELPPAPVRGDRLNFPTVADTFVAALPGFRDETNAVGLYVQGEAEAVSAAVESAGAASDQAQSSATQAQEFSEIAAAVAGYAGVWADLTGSLDAGASSYHEDEFWILMESVADVTAHEPGVSPSWSLPPATPASRILIDPVPGLPADQVQQAIEMLVQMQGMPGDLKDWPGATAPDGWFVRNGQAISRTENPGLFAVIGTMYGAGDGSTTFNVPDDVTGNRFVRAAGGAIAVGATQDNQNAEHTHTGSTNSTGSHNHTYTRRDVTFTGGNQGIGGNTYANNSSGPTVNTSSAGAHTHTLTIDNQGGSEARPNSRAYLPLIRGG
jgi:microcystin-dependent protein